MAARGPFPKTLLSSFLTHALIYDEIQGRLRRPLFLRTSGSGPEGLHMRWEKISTLPIQYHTYSSFLALRLFSLHASHRM